jgi:hypothetical protein
VTPVIQWLNANRYRHYPFKEDARLDFACTVPTANSWVLPDSVLLDLQYVVYRAIVPDGAALRLYAVRAEDTDFNTLIFRFALGNTYFDDIIVPRTISTTPVVLTQDGVRLQIVFGADGVNELLDQLETITDLRLYLATETAEHFEPITMTKQDKHRVNSLVGNTDESVAVSGDIYWEGGYNTCILLQPAMHRIRIMAEPGAGSGRYCGRIESDRPACDGILLAINELYADGYGKFQLTGADGIAIIPEPDEHRLTIKTCVTPADIDCEASRG